MERVEITIIGAGVVGLGAAFELSRLYRDIFVIEKNASFGAEISSRNSEVIHAGLYYPRDSLKTKTCIEGRRLIYEFCAENNIAHKKIGKLIVAINKDEVLDLENLFKRGLENGVDDLEFLPKSRIREIEPNVLAEAAIYSPSTGIVDSHGLMKELLFKFEAQNGSIAYNTELKAVDKVKDGFEVTVEDKNAGLFKFFTRLLINAAGLNSDKVAKLAGLEKEEYKLKYCKGSYFRLNSSKAGFINRLVYPVPKKNRAGLGIHATLDLSGSLRLGPDDEYVEKIDYNVDISKRRIFYESAGSFLPFIELADLNPDVAGIRPKLQGQGEDFRDYVIKDESEEGLRGLVNLIGIESPGLTASLAIAKMVRGIIKDLI